MRRAWLVALALAAACARPAEPEVVVYTTLDRAVAAPVLQKLAERTARRIGIVYGHDELYGRLLAESGKPRADLLWAADSVRPLMLAQRNLTEDLLPGRFARARVLVVNPKSGAAPRSLIDLLDPRWKGRVAIPDPTGGDGALHVAALAAVWGDERAQKFLEALQANGARVARDDAEVVQLVQAGDAAIGVTGDGALPADVTKIYPDAEGAGTLLVSAAVVVLAGAPHPARATELARLLSSAPEVGAVKTMKLRDDDVARALERLSPFVKSWARKASSAR